MTYKKNNNSVNYQNPTLKRRKMHNNKKEFYQF